MHFRDQVPGNTGQKKHILEKKNTRGKSMTPSDAIGIAEGFIEAENKTQFVDAWQYLIDTGLCWDLQGWFGRTAVQMIESGICTAPGQPSKSQIDDFCDACECTPCDCSWGNY